LTMDNPFLGFAEALARHVGFSLDVPFEQLEPAHQRAILHGTDEAWIPLDPVEATPGSGGRRPSSSARQRKAASAGRTIRFQYKGLFPAIDEASRVSFVYRHKLDHLVNEVACSTCGGSRLRDDAGACPFQGRTLGELCSLPLGRALAVFKGLKLTKDQRPVGGEVLPES